MQLPHGDGSRGVDPVLSDPGGEFGEVDGLQRDGEGVVESALAMHDFIGRLSAVEGPAERVDEGDCASFLLPAHTLARCFALS